MENKTEKGDYLGGFCKPPRKGDGLSVCRCGCGSSDETRCDTGNILLSELIGISDELSVVVRMTC
jgi:hypothetical protein